MTPVHPATLQARHGAVAGEVPPLSVSGGYWTGASAIVDLLAEHPDAAVVPGEFTLFSFGQFFQEITTPLGSGRPALAGARRTLWRYRQFNVPEPFSLLRRAMRRSLAAVRQYPASLSVARTSAGTALGPRYAVACRDLLEMIERDMASDGALDLARTRMLIGEVLGAAALGAHDAGLPAPKVGVFDQLVAPPYLTDATAVVPGLRTIMVDRDWRDQYLSMRPAFRRMSAVNRRLGVRPWDEAASGPPPGFRAYFVGLRQRIEAERMRVLRVHGSLVRWMRFEEIVREPVTAAGEVFSFLDLDPARWSSGRRFHPERSMRRVGKWKAAEWRGTDAKREIDELTEILGDPERRDR